MLEEGTGGPMKCECGQFYDHRYGNDGKLIICPCQHKTTLKLKPVPVSLDEYDGIGV